MKTSALTGAALDWAVAIVEDMCIEVRPKSACGRPLYVLAAEQGREPWLWYPSTDWAQAGPIIEKEKMSMSYQQHDKFPDICWTAYAGDDNPRKGYSGPTPLIAAMRCYVASKLGDEVEIPKDLT
jgi:hypothetical protein